MPCGSSGGPRGCRPHYCLGSPIHYDGDGTGKNPYRNTVDQNIYKADAMIYYRIPVIRDIVKLRAGAGVGVWGIMIFSTSVSRAKTRSFPMSMRVSIGSSGAAVIWNSSSVRPWCYARRSSIIRLSGLEGGTDVNPWLTNYFGFCLGIGYRF